jgi:xylulokinase
MALRCAARIAIGIDVGTSSVKATAITSDGEILSRQSRPYASTIPLDGEVEQNPDDWWEAIGEALSLLLAALPHVDRENTTIGLTGQMHTSVLRDGRGALIRPAILWSDKRASAECTELSAAVPGIADILGNPLMPAFSIAHIAWLRSHEPESFGRIGSILVPKDDVRRRFGAGETTEPSDASGTGLLDTRTDEWSDRILETVGLKREMMPAILPSHAVSGRICALPPGSVELRRLFGVPVVGGAGDQAAQAVALGVTAPGQLGISIGTSGVAFRALNEPAPRSFRHAYDNRWLALNSTHAAGLALSWFALISQQPVPDLAEAPVHAETAPLFLPYLQGHRDQVGAPGALIDLDVRHGAPDIAYAVMEGVAFELVRLAESVGDGHIPPGSVYVGGGGGRSERWRSLLANALDRSVVFSDRDSSFGAARIAAEAAGWFKLFAENDRVQASKTDPDPSARALTDARHSRFSELAAILAPANHGDAS